MNITKFEFRDSNERDEWKGLCVARKHRVVVLIVKDTSKLPGPPKTIYGDVKRKPGRRKMNFGNVIRLCKDYWSPQFPQNEKWRFSTTYARMRLASWYLIIKASFPLFHSQLICLARLINFNVDGIPKEQADNHALKWRQAYFSIGRSQKYLQWLDGKSSQRWIVFKLPFPSPWRRLATKARLKRSFIARPWHLLVISHDKVALDIVDLQE